MIRFINLIRLIGCKMVQYDVYKFLISRKAKWMTNAEISEALKSSRQVVMDATRKLFKSGYLDRRRRSESFYYVYEYRRIEKK